jgi:hypothetical protein
MSDPDPDAGTLNSILAFYDTAFTLFLSAGKIRIAAAHKIVLAPFNQSCVIAQFVDFYADGSFESVNPWAYGRAGLHRWRIQFNYTVNGLAHPRAANGASGATCCLAPNKLSHIERIDVVTVNPERMSLHSLSLEAKLIVEPDSSAVVAIDHQLKAMQPL